MNYRNMMLEELTREAQYAKDSVDVKLILAEFVHRCQTGELLEEQQVKDLQRIAFDSGQREVISKLKAMRAELQELLI